VANLGGQGRNYRDETEQLLRMADQTIERECGPHGGIALAIVKAATNCRDNVKQWIDSDTESDRQQTEIYLYFELLYFYMHMTLLKVVGRVNSAQLQKLQDFLILLIPATAIDSYFAHWPTHLKEKMNDEFIERLNDAEREYTECDKDNKIAPVLMLLAKNIFDLLGLEEFDESKVRIILEVVMRELEGMQMNKLIQAMR